MAIYRGTGGASGTTSTANVEAVLEASTNAQNAAAAANVSETNAASSAASASSSATDAATSETNAASSASAAASSATSSATSATASQTAQTAAETAETNAETAQAAAEVAQAAAEAAQAAAETAETNAETAETNAATSYANTLAIYGNTTDVANAVAAAAASETAAAASEAAAATSETNAATSETNAAASETAAASSASAASTSASAASTSATAAASSATAAATSATTAEGYKDTVVAKEALMNPYYTDIDTVSANMSSILNVNNNLTSINAFGDTYFIAASEPSSPTEGDLWFDTSTDTMKVYNGSSWQNAGSSVNGTSERVTYTATEGQTTFNATYDSGYVDVYLNGIKLIANTDFTATNGSSVVLASGAAADDTVDIVAYGTFELADVYTKTVSDGRYVAQTDIGVTVQAYDATLLNDADIGVTVQGYDATTLKSSDIGTTVQAYDADTAKTDVAQTFTAEQTFTEFKETAYSLTGTDIDPANGSIQYKTLSANTTFTESLEDGQSVALRLEGGATFTVTWPTMTWIGSGGNVAPTLNGTKDVVVIWQENFTVYGAYVGYGA